MIRGMLTTATLHSSEPDSTAWQDNSRLNLSHGLNDHLDEPRMNSVVARW